MYVFIYVYGLVNKCLFRRRCRVHVNLRNYVVVCVSVSAKVIVTLYVYLRVLFRLRCVGVFVLVRIFVSVFFNVVFVCSWSFAYLFTLSCAQSSQSTFVAR